MPPKRASMRVSNQQKGTGELYKSPKKSAALSSGGKQRNGTACSREQKGGKTGRSKGKGKGQSQKGKEGKRKSVGRGQSQSCHQCRQSIHSNKGVSEVKRESSAAPA